jgi:hypothetical protein
LTRWHLLSDVAVSGVDVVAVRDIVDSDRHGLFGPFGLRLGGLFRHDGTGVEVASFDERLEGVCRHVHLEKFARLGPEDGAGADDPM